MKRLLLPLLAALALPTAINAEIDPKILKICMKAADFQGCVKALGGQTNEPIKTTVVSDKQNDLLLEIKKLSSRIQNTSLRDYSSRTLSFTDALAISTPEEVGFKLYENAQKLSLSLDILYTTWSRDIKIDESTMYWDPQKNLNAKRSLDLIFGGNTFEVKCKKRWAGLFGGGNIKVGENILLPVVKTIVYASQQLKTADSEFNFPSLNEAPLFRSSLTEYCPGDPNAPVEEVKQEEKDKPKKPVKINCKSPVWKNKPQCKK